MTVIHTKEKSNKIIWAKGIQKDYELENRIRDSRTHIYIRTEGEFKQINRSIVKFSNRSTMEFDTIFKLYKTQNYPLDIKYFQGTSYTLPTLKVLRTHIKAATNVGTCNKSFKIIAEFINEIKGSSTPFPYLWDNSGNKLVDLIGSTTLTTEEIQFLNSPILPRKNKNKAINHKTDKHNVIIERKQKMEKERNSNREDLYNIIIDNYDKGTKHVLSLTQHIVDIKPNSIKSYVAVCRRLAKGADTIKNAPSTLINMFKAKHQAPIDLSEKIANSCKSSTLATNKSSQFILIDNDKVVSHSNSLDYLRGYRDAGSQKNLKIYQIVES